MGRLLAGLLMLAAAIHAADVTGTWSGPMTVSRGDVTRDDSAYLVLKQTGTEITGTIGPNAEKRLTITKGSADGDNVYIEAKVDDENKMVLRLKFQGEKLVGELKAEGPSAPTVSGKMSLTREK